MRLLKYCNIKNIFETRTAGLLGIPFLGYHLVSENDFKRKETIKKCVKELRSFYPSTKSILVTKEKNINSLIKLIREFEFDGVQLHYPDSDGQSVALKGEFGGQFIIFQVLTPENEDFQPSQCDYVIVDKSYLGGTATQIPKDKLNQIVSKLSDKNIMIFIAGGISPDNIFQHLELPGVGFDVQSFLKSDCPGEFENTDYIKMKSLAGLLGYAPIQPSSQVGFVIQDIMQENCDLYKKAMTSNVDFFHVDISDGFVGIPTDLQATSILLDQIVSLNTHINLQLHFFVSSEKSFEKIVSSIFSSNKYPKKTFFVHINRDNYNKFSSKFINKKYRYFGLDIKDIIDESFPWEQFIKDQMIICLQSREHADRIANLNQGIKLIRYSSNINPIINIDRSIDLNTVLNIDDLSNLNVVCGSYLRDDIQNRYQLIKDYLHAQKNNT